MPEKKKLQLGLSFAPNAVSNLEQIEDYITENGNSDLATKVVDKILDRCEDLNVMPKSGKPREDIAHGLRSVTSGMYVIYYRIHSDKIEILRIWHGARDNAALIGEI